MNPDPASLDNLKDIAEPTAVSWWPPAIGWWALLAILLVIATRYAIGLLRRWNADAYRRAALRELESASSNADISKLLKRTALAAFPRTDVASLSGQRWCQWLGETSGIKLTDSVRQSLEVGVFGNVDSENQKQLREFASSWVRGHSNPTEDRKGRKES